ncbi:MAG: flagellar biosynthesis anti-sigma factor FlgM [Acidobacteriota bacterium]
MRIDGVNSTSLNSEIQGSQNDPHSQAVESSNRRPNEDRVEFSDTGRQLAGSRAEESSETRTEAVREITNQVRAGTFQVDSNAVAESILNQHTIASEL